MTEYFHYDPITDTTAIEYVQDVEPNLDYSKALANDDEYTKEGIKGEYWHYAHIPVSVQMKWLVEYGRENWPMLPQNKKLLFKLLNSREWRYLKTTHKTHS